MSTDRRTELFAVSILFLITVPGFVLLRLWTRRIKGLRIFSEDWMLVIALIINVGNCINLIIATTLGYLGSHDRIGPDGHPIVSYGRIIAFKAGYIEQVLAYPTEGLTKISLLLLYRRIFEWRTFRIINNFWLGIVVVWTVAFFFGTVFQCLPISTFWDTPSSSFTPGKCIETHKFYLAGAVSDVITDAMILILPVPCIWRLQMPLHRKLSITPVFLLGAFVLGTGSYRIDQFVQSAKFLNSGHQDVTYDEAGPILWTLIEMSTGVICACLPTFAPLFDASIQGSMAYYWPRSLSLQSLSPRNRSLAASKQTVSDDGSRGREVPRRKFTHPWESVSMTGESSWQTEEVPLRDRYSTVAEEGDGIVVKHSVQVEVV